MAVDHLEPIVERIVARIPLRAFQAMAGRSGRYPVAGDDVDLFAVPVIPLFPLKLVGLWLLAHEYWASAITVIVFGKIRGRRRHRIYLDVTRHQAAADGLVQEIIYQFILMLRARQRRWSSRSSTGSATCCVVTAPAGQPAC